MEVSPFELRTQACCEWLSEGAKLVSAGRERWAVFRIHTQKPEYENKIGLSNDSHYSSFVSGGFQYKQTLKRNHSFKNRRTF